MEKWEEKFREKFVSKGGFLTELMAKNVLMFIRILVKEERAKDTLKELMDYVKNNKSNTDILINYVMNKYTNRCVGMNPSQELLDELGIKIYEREVMILYILEKYFNERDESS